MADGQTKLSYNKPAIISVKYDLQKLTVLNKEKFVRSESERMISEASVKAEIGFHYEKPFIARDKRLFKLSDFTFKYKRKEFYWEHNGMLDGFDY